MRYAAYSVAGRMFLLDRMLPHVERQGVLDTLLFSLLSADDETCGDSPPMAWVEEASAALQACGWSLRKQHFTAVIEPCPGDCSDNPVVDALFKVFADQLSGMQKASLTAALRALKTSVQAPPQSLLMSPGPGVRANMGLVQADGILKLASVDYADGQSPDLLAVDNLFHQVELRGGASGSYLSARFNVDAFNQYKEGILHALEGQQELQIKHLGDF